MFNLIKLLIPPIIISLKNYLQNKHFGYLFSEKYDSLIDLNRNYNLGSYLQSNQHKESLSNFLANRNNIEYSLRNSILPIFISSFKKKEFRILDVGGGFNPCIDYIEHSQKKKIELTVIERLEIVNDLREIEIDNTRVEYKTEFPEKFFDMFFFGSSFQYFLEFNKIEKAILNCGPDYIIIADTAFYEGKKDIFSLQVNMFPSIIPYKINSISNLENTFNNLGYKVIYRSKRTCGKHKNVDNKKLHARDIIFKKI